MNSPLGLGLGLDAAAGSGGGGIGGGPRGEMAAAYLQACAKLDLAPLAGLADRLRSDSVDLTHYGLVAGHAPLGDPPVADEQVACSHCFPFPLSLSLSHLGCSASAR